MASFSIIEKSNFARSSCEGLLSGNILSNWKVEIVQMSINRRKHKFSIVHIHDVFIFGIKNLNKIPGMELDVAMLNEKKQS